MLEQYLTLHRLRERIAEQSAILLEGNPDSRRLMATGQSSFGRQRRALRLWRQAVFALSGRRAAGLMNITRKTLAYRSRRPPQDGLRMRLREVAPSRVRFGYRRLTVILRREGWRVNPKRIYRLYTEDGLTVLRHCLG